MALQAPKNEKNGAAGAKKCTKNTTIKPSFVSSKWEIARTSLGLGLGLGGGHCGVTKWVDSLGGIAGKKGRFYPDMRKI